jgi:hypothetical protein
MQTEIQEPSLDVILFQDPRTPAKEPFTVDSLDKANWTARKIIQAEERIQKRLAMAEEYKSRIDVWLNHANKADTESVEFLSSLLRPFVENEVKAQRSKTVRLLGVNASLRKLPEKIELTNPEMALNFCELHHPEALIIKKDLSRAELKKLFQQGELIPGVLLSGGATNLYLRPTDELPPHHDAVLPE